MFPIDQIDATIKDENVGEFIYYLCMLNKNYIENYGNDPSLVLKCEDYIENYLPIYLEEMKKEISFSSNPDEIFKAYITSISNSFAPEMQNLISLNNLSGTIDNIHRELGRLKKENSIEEISFDAKDMLSAQRKFDARENKNQNKIDKFKDNLAVIDLAREKLTELGQREKLSKDKKEMYDRYDMVYQNYVYTKQNIYKDIMENYIDFNAFVYGCSKFENKASIKGLKNENLEQKEHQKPQECFANV